MYIGELYQQLIEEARRRVSAGIVTERQLARLCGLSQPHMHNVLKNFRSLSTDSADRLMEALRVDIPELLFRFQKIEDLNTRAVPIVRSYVGPGYQPVFTCFRGFMPMPSGLVDPLRDPIIIQIAADMGLPKPLMVNDLALIDRSTAVRGNPMGNSLWLVAEGGAARIRYVKRGGTRIYVANETTHSDPSRWTSLSLKETSILELICGRVVWFSRSIGLKMAEQRLNDVA